MSHNLASGIISAAVLPFDDSGAIDWKTLERYIIQVAAGRSARDRHEHGGERGQLAGSAGATRGHPALQGDARRRVHLAVGAQRHAHRRRGRSCQAPRRCGAEGLVVFPPVAGVPQRAVGIDDRRLPRCRGRGRGRVPLLAFQTNFCSYPKGTISALSQIPAIVSIKDASFNVEQTLDNVKEATARSGRSAC